MADAVVKVSWRKSPSGLVLAGAQGGVCGTCFTMESGITISCAHNMGGLFNPNPGFDVCRAFVVEVTGRITELYDGCLQLYPDYDACVIGGFSSRTLYKASQKQPGQIALCSLRGYEAGTAPFQCDLSPTGMAVNISNPRINSVALDLRGLVPQPTTQDINAPDVKIFGKQWYLMKANATIGLSGGPMLDAVDGTAVGMCFVGLPPDVHQKTLIGAIDIRQFQFI